MSVDNEQRTGGSIFRVLVSAKRTFGVLWHEYRRGVIVTALVAVCLAVMPMTGAWCVKQLVNGIVAGRGVEELQPFVFGVAAAAGGLLFLMNLRFYMERRNWYTMNKLFDIRVAQKKAEVLDIARFESTEAQNIFQLYQTDGGWRVGNFVNCFALLLWHGVAALIAVTVILFEQWWICLAIFIATLPILLVELYVGLEMWGIHHGRGPTKRRYFHILGCFQTTAYLSELKTQESGLALVDWVRSLLTGFERDELRAERLRLLYQTLAQTFYMAIYGVTLFVLLTQVVRGSIGLGTFTFLLAAIEGYRIALSGFFGELGRMRDVERFVDNTWKLLDLKPSLEWKTQGPNLADRPCDLSFEGVVAGYADKTKPVLNGLNLEIRQGERVAIVGPNGAGKSTLRRLLQREFDPREGTVAVGGVNLSELDKEQLYGSFAFLSQDTNRFHFTVKDVIALGNTSVPLDEDLVRRAAIFGGADGFIEDPDCFPLGYDQLLGRPDGVELSGGQWRRLAFARFAYRMMTKDARVLVLDEPTAQVDGEGAQRLFDAIREEGQGRTLILVTHLLADIRAIADRVIVISEGRVVEDGTHDELMRREGVYFDLFKAQAMEIEAEPEPRLAVA